MAKIQELYSEVVIKYDEASVSGLLNLLGELEKKSDDLHDTLSGQLNKTFKDTGKASGLLTKQTDQLATVMKKPVKNSGMLVKQTTQLAVVMEKQTKKNKTFKQSLVVISSMFVRVSKNSKRMGSDIKKSFLEATKESKKFKKSMSGMQKLATAGLTYVGVASVKDFYKESAEGYEVQFSNEFKLGQLLKENEKIRDGALDRLKKNASALQSQGVIGDEVTLAGYQQLETYKLQEKTLTAFGPLIANAIVQQKGLNGTTQDSIRIADQIGRAMSGEVTALRSMKIYLDDTQKYLLKNGTEEQKRNILVKALEKKYRELNKEIRKTDPGILTAQKNAWGDIKEEIGKEVIPLVSDFYGLLLENKEEIREISVGFLHVGKAIMDEVLPKIKDVMGKLSEDDIKNFFDKGVTGAHNLAEAMKPLMALGKIISDVASFGKMPDLWKDENETIAINAKNKELKKELELRKKIYKQKFGMEFGTKGKIANSQKDMYSKYRTMDATKIGDVKLQELEAGKNTIIDRTSENKPSIFNTTTSSNSDMSKKIINHISINVTTKREDEIARRAAIELGTVFF